MLLYANVVSSKFESTCLDNSGNSGTYVYARGTILELSHQNGEFLTLFTIFYDFLRVIVLKQGRLY